MNLAYFRSFLAVVKHGGFSEAAKTLGLSQPTVSFQVQRLEQEVAAKLLERQSGRVAVTAAGQEFRSFAEKVLHERAYLDEKLAALQDEVAGTLALGASTHPGEYILPRVVGDFRKLFPNVDATIMIGDTAEIVERVLDRQCDAGLVGAHVKRRGLEVTKIAEDALLLIAPPDHPFAKRERVSLQDLAAESFVVREEGSGTQKTVEELLQASGVQPSRLPKALVAGSNQAAVTAVEAGVGLAFASRMAAARSLELGRITAVTIDGVNWTRGIYYVYPSRPVQTRLFAEFSAFVRAWGWVPTT